MKNDWKYAITLSVKNGGQIMHCVCLEESPNIATLKELFEELMIDNDFGFNDQTFVDTLIFNMYNYKNFVEYYPNLAPKEEYDV